MARGRKPRTWIKIDCEGILRGSINYLLTLEGQAVWMKMIALSEICGGKPGYIEDNNENGLPLDYLAQELHCSVEVLKAVLKAMEGDGAIDINGTGSIHLVNFAHYQFSEYDRQRPYRQAKKERGKSTQLEEKLQTITTCYEENIGMLTPIIREDLIEACDKFPDGWFQDAVAEAVRLNKRNLKYILAILNRWQAEGRGPAAKSVKDVLQGLKIEE